MRAGRILGALLAIPLGSLAAQDVAIGPQALFGDYREVSSDLHYRGTGGGLALADELKHEHGKRIFLDLKLFDISATIEAAVRGLAQYDL
ncbi:MAG: orotidine 5'-phosphate decarboxylase / HUMPS family protein, partial [Gemmatimonadales bacterium]|nr:orotidine 5'-phosphate decarboxylase / HUMPS family protein [Gemmatimonadales bacterium]